MNKILKTLFFLIILGLFIGSIVSFKSTNPIGEKIIGFSVLIGAFIFLTAILILMNFLADLLYLFLDPRVSYKTKN